MNLRVFVGVRQLPHSDSRPVNDAVTASDVR
jgi:hypothetical protein